MFSKTNLISTIATTLWAFFGGYLLWGIIGETLLVPHALTTEIMRESPDFIHLILGNLIMAFGFSTIYGKWANGIFSTSGGLKFGFLVALIAGVGEGLVDLATIYLLDIPGTFMNIALYIIFYLVMGVIASMVYRKF